MILKIQKSIMTDNGITRYLVYNEDRSLEFETDDSSFNILFKDGVYKIYVNYTENNLRQCEDQPW